MQDRKRGKHKLTHQTKTQREELQRGCNQNSFSGFNEFSSVIFDSAVKGTLSEVLSFIGSFLKTFGFEGYNNTISI